MTLDLLRAASRRTQEANAKILSGKRASGASVASYLAAGHQAGAGEAGPGLGLVYYSTSDAGASPARVSIEIDPLQARSQRLRKSTITGARLHDQEARHGGFRGAWYFVTMTYARPSDASPRDISALMKNFRTFFHRTNARKGKGKQPFRYLWVGELTQALVPHYHLMLWVPTGFYFPKPDRKGWWPHGHTEFQKARNPVAYMAKYASKFTSICAAAFPKGFRTHGIGGLNEESKRELRYWKAPVDARNALGQHADIRKTLGGYFDRLTAVFWPSPWKVTFIYGRTIAWKIQ